MRQAGTVGYTLDLGGWSGDTRPVVGALSRLQRALSRRGFSIAEWREGSPKPAARLVAASADSALARKALAEAGRTLPTAPEALALVRSLWQGQPATVAVGTDPCGLSYALSELADRVLYANDPLEGLAVREPRLERPANPVRGVARLFVSDVEDKGWFSDRDFWRRYFAMLSRHRFNRFHLAFGIGHDFLRDVRDAYFLFPYPFLLEVPGYRVRATGLPDEERDRNLETLRFISEEASAHGLHFQLGLWTHGYRWHDSPHANYTIEGLEPERHAAYCRAALGQLLSECPSIAGLTLRVHGESGVPEGSHSFWREVFSGAADAGRRIELDLHPKGLDRETIDLALATGLPVTLSPKYAAEHQGLPYHQAAIRGLERETRRGSGDSFVAGLMSRSGGDLRYTRYSYADFLAEDRPYGVYFRVWPGTRRLFLSGDPAFVAALSRSASFCGSLGLDVMEPLSMKGRRGSAIAHEAAGSSGRLACADPALATDDDFEKYEYGYLLLGRYLFDPDTDASTWRHRIWVSNPETEASTWRQLPSNPLWTRPTEKERALCLASRILPLITSAHLPSAANNLYWPEIYTDMPIADSGRPHHYGDTPSPKRFGTVSPLDPALFQSIAEFAVSATHGEPDPRYSPVSVAGWLEELSRGALDAVASLPESLAEEARRARALVEEGASFLDWVDLDVTAQALLGEFFAQKLRSGVAYELWKTTGERRWLATAVERYRRGREVWARLARFTSDAYSRDITFGGEPWLRGSWADRLAGIDQNVADVEAELETVGGARDESFGDSALEALDPPPPGIDCRHVPPQSFSRSEAVPISLEVSEGDEDAEIRAWLHYRHVNQAEDYVRVEMARGQGGFEAEIAAAYTDAPYSLIYFFELRRGRSAQLWPGLGDDLAQQPYFVARMLRSS